MTRMDTESTVILRTTCVTVTSPSPDQLVMPKAPVTAFDQLKLSPPVFKALEDVGYETPSPIQAETIPLLLEGKDMVGQARQVQEKQQHLPCRF